ncbi:15897_t:CDS:2, partial [Dentiscutata heterogama]
MKRFFSVETNSKKDISEKEDENQVEPSTEILSNEKPKRNKIRSSPNPKDVNGILFMFCKWCESKNYANELAKGTSNYRKQSIDRHLNHHEHKAEAEARKNQNIMAIKFSLQLATDAFMNLCNTPAALELPSHLLKNLPLESNEYGSHLSETSAKDIEEAIVYVIEKALYEEIRSSINWSIMIDETNSITNEKHLAIVSRHMFYIILVTRYLGIINLDELNAEAIILDLKIFFIAKGLEIKNLLHFCSDGAATLIGKKTGVVKRFQEINPFITSVHCITHRLHLAEKDAAKHVPYFNQYETSIKKLYIYFSSSYQRMQNLKMVQDILENPQLTILNT